MSIDPTRIDMDLDPTKARFSGIAYHGNTPFDVPYISQITDNLWMGGCQTGLVLPEFIKHTVTLYPWERYTVRHELDSELAVRMFDTAEGTPDIKLVDDIACWILGRMKSGPTSLTCQAGLNRSGLIAAWTLMIGFHKTADQAIALLREKRSPAVLCNPTFEAFLRRKQ